MEAYTVNKSDEHTPLECKMKCPGIEPDSAADLYDGRRQS
jgi:hypothetical protein